MVTMADQRAPGRGCGGLAVPSLMHRDLSGIVQPGRGLGAGLMADRAVMENLQKLTGFAVVPGTLNVRLPRPLERVGPSWRYVAAAEITADWGEANRARRLFPGARYSRRALSRSRVPGGRAGRARLPSRPDRAVLRGSPAQGAQPQRRRRDCGLAERQLIAIAIGVPIEECVLDPGSRTPPPACPAM